MLTLIRLLKKENVELQLILLTLNTRLINVTMLTWTAPGTLITLKI